MYLWLSANWPAILAGWVVLAVLAEPISTLLDSLFVSVSRAFLWLSEGLRRVAERMQRSAVEAASVVEAFFGAAADLLDRLRSWSAALATFGANQAAVLWRSFSADDPSALKHAIGVLVVSSLAVLFLWADFSLIANAIQVAEPRAAIPAFLTSRTVPLMTASAGTAFTLGFLWFDLHDGNGLIRWPKNSGLLSWVVALLFVVSIVLSLLINGERIVEAPAVPESVRQCFRSAYSWALVGITVPLLATTACLFPALRIVELLPVAVLGLAGFLGLVLRGSLDFLGHLTRDIGRFAGVLCGAGVQLLRLATELAAFLILGVSYFVAGLSSIVARVVDVLSFPTRPVVLLWHLVVRLIGSRTTPRSAGKEVARNAADSPTSRGTRNNSGRAATQSATQDSADNSDALGTPLRSPASRASRSRTRASTDMG